MVEKLVIPPVGGYRLRILAIALLKWEVYQQQ